jgi:hypothetical protein
VPDQKNISEIPIVVMIKDLKKEMLGQGEDQMRI